MSNQIEVKLTAIGQSMKASKLADKIGITVEQAKQLKLSGCVVLDAAILAEMKVQPGLLLEAVAAAEKKTSKTKTHSKSERAGGTDGRT